MNPALPFVQHIDHGIRVIDTGFHRPIFDASYLIVEEGRAAFVDTGTNHSIPRLVAALHATGLARDAVDYVIVTHVHLVHAGGAGLLMQYMPKAKLVVHQNGARHLIDPQRLLDGARAVYGDEEVSRSYGDLVPIPAERVLSTEDQMTIDLAGRSLKFIDTPGHARHHHCIFDERSRGFFTGDTFGLSYREFDTAKGPWQIPTTTPVQFEPEAMRASVNRLLTFAPEWVYLTHYGRVGEPARLAELMLGQMDEMVALAIDIAATTSDNAQRHEAMVQGFARIHLRSLRQHGCTLSDERVLDLLKLDNELNAQGIAVWLKRRHRA
jgi:glyoxylase-like metal-dependent hydrolase (beta-lactamase superfamily II)